MLYFDTSFYLFIQKIFIQECVPFKAFKRNFGINMGNYLTLNITIEKGKIYLITEKSFCLFSALDICFYFIFMKCFDVNITV